MDRDPLAKPRVLLADDNQSIINLVSEVLGSDFEIIGTVLNGAAALEAVEQLNPDILVIDIVMPVLDGIETLRRLKRKRLLTKILFLTALEDSSHVREILEASADGYVFKSRLTEDLPQAIRAVLAGRNFASPWDSN